MKRAPSIEAMIRKSRTDLGDLKKAYDASLHERVVREDLKVEIKNIFENLRSCLDYLAQEIHETFCKQANKPQRLYFPIRRTPAEFERAVEQDYPGLAENCKAVFEILESMQPFRNPWLGQFNTLNNANKHQDLVEQTKTESRRVKVTRPGSGSVSWGPGVTFGPDVQILGVPIDSETQLPVPNNKVTINITIWVDFKFRENEQSVLPFIETSIERVDKTYQNLARYC